MKTFLLIGGDRAGQRIVLERAVDVLRMPKRKEAPSFFSNEAPQAVKISEDFDIYRFEVISGRKGYVEVYCLEVVNIIGELLQGYHPITKQV